MSLQPIGGRETGLSWDGLTSIMDYYIEPYIAPGYKNSQYSGLPTAEDPFGGSVDILPDSEPEPALSEAVKEINFNSPIVLGVGLVLLLALLK